MNVALPPSVALSFAEKRYKALISHFEVEGIPTAGAAGQGDHDKGLCLHGVYPFLRAGYRVMRLADGQEGWQTEGRGLPIPACGRQGKDFPNFETGGPSR